MSSTDSRDGVIWMTDMSLIIYQPSSNKNRNAFSRYFYPSAQQEMWSVSCCDTGLSQTMAHLFLHCQLALKAQLSNLIVLPAELGALLLIYSLRREKIGCEMRFCGCGVCLYSLKHGYRKVALTWNDKSKCFGVLQ